MTPTELNPEGYVALIHLPLGDAWDVPDYQTRGLRISDLRRMAY